MRRVAIAPMRASAGRLRDAWYAAAQSKQVGRGRPLGRAILGERIALWRLKNGSIACISDHCAHRNALLSEGKVIADEIACPYHGWMYDHGGACTMIPSAGPNDVSCHRFQIPKFPVHERDGLVWVWFGYGAPDHEPFEMPHYDEPGWRTYYMETEFSNGVTHLVENFMDVPHTVFVHGTWFRRRRARRVEATVERTTDSVLVTYHDQADSIGVTDRILNPRGLPLMHTDKFFMPNNTRVDYVYGDSVTAFVIASTCTPIEPFRTRVFTLISYKLGFLNPFAGLFLPWYTRKVIQQDVEIMSIQGRSLRHLGATAFNETPADSLHEDIEALRHCAAEDRPIPAPRTRRMEFWI